MNHLKNFLSIDKNTASGWYSAARWDLSVVEKWTNDFRKTCEAYKGLTAEESSSEKLKPFLQADYIGFGWVLIKKGVFGSMEYHRVA